MFFSANFYFISRKGKVAEGEGVCNLQLETGDGSIAAGAGGVFNQVFGDVVAAAVDEQFAAIVAEGGFGF